MTYRGGGQIERTANGSNSYQYDGTGQNIVNTGSGNASMTRTQSGVDISEHLSSGTYYYYLYDSIGSVVGLTDSAGSIVDSCSYDPYGNTISATGSVPNTYRFIGAEWDAATGLYKMGERYYDPTTGRFGQDDPTGGSQAYADNDPVNFADPSGLAISRPLCTPMPYPGSWLVPAAAGVAAFLYGAGSWVASHWPGGGSGGGCSFASTTQVKTQEGTKPISQIKVGDKGLAYDPSTRKLGWYVVTEVLRDDDTQLEELSLGQERLLTTPNHPFYSKNYGWEAAGNLHPGDKVLRADGHFGTVERVDIFSGRQVMYNLTVSSVHDYFVGKEEWLVHNRCPNPWGRRGSTQLRCGA